MENKYYTPEIEELRDVRTPYEYRYSYKNSSKEWLEIEDEDYNDRLLSDHIEVRVKYLDRKDIESLGWEYDDIWRDGGTSLFKKGNDMLAFYGTNRLTNNPLRVIILKDSKQDKHLFDGTIKNKSELKKLLKQLEI